MGSLCWLLLFIHGLVSLHFIPPIPVRTDIIVGVVKGYRMRYGWLIVLIVGIWCFAVFLTILGPALRGNHFFTRAGGWVSSDFHSLALCLCSSCNIVLGIGRLRTRTTVFALFVDLHRGGRYYRYLWAYFFPPEGSTKKHHQQ